MTLFSNRIIELIEDLNPSQILLQTDVTAFTAGDLLSNSKQLGRHLLQIGMKAGDRVVIASAPGIDFVKIMFSTMMVGAEVAIIDPEMGRDNYKNKLKQFQPSWVFLDARILLLQKNILLRKFYFWWRKRGLYFPPSPQIKKIITGPKLPFTTGNIRLDQFGLQWNNLRTKRCFS